MIKSFDPRRIGSLPCLARASPFNSQIVPIHTRKQELTGTTFHPQEEKLLIDPKMSPVKSPSISTETAVTSHRPPCETSVLHAEKRPAALPALSVPAAVMAGCVAPSLHSTSRGAVKGGLSKNALHNQEVFKALGHWSFFKVLQKSTPPSTHLLAHPTHSEAWPHVLVMS